MNWKEILKIEKQRELKYKRLVEVKEQNGKWFIFCKKHNKVLVPYTPFATSSFYEQIDKVLEEC